MSDRNQAAESQIRELKVSGHTMALEPGLYCVYNAPGGPVANEAGLPGVRITAGPGAGTGRGRITVSTFTPDGWIGADSAALVRVTEGPANLLVTVYQAPDSRTDAPKLQVVLLSGAAAAPQAEAPAIAAQRAVQSTAKAAQQAPESVELVAHVYGRGDVAGRLGEWMGEPGSQRWIEGFGIAAPDGIAAGDIEYQAVLGRGWLSPWSGAGDFCGSRGMSLPILGLRVRLRGDAAKTHRVSLSASFVDGTRVGPVTDGEPCEAPSLAALEAFQVAFEPAGGTETAEKKPRGRAAKTAAPEPEAVPQMPAKRPRAQNKAATKAESKAGATPAQVEPAQVKLAQAKPGRTAAAKKQEAQPPAPAPVAKPARGKAAAARAEPAMPVKPPARGVKRTPATTRRR